MYYGLINSMNKTVAPSYTARTTAFATATGITDTTILGALNTFDLGLISNSLDTKMKALYPFVGGTSTTQKYNFMDARDLDVAFRLQFFGGGTFSSNGYQPNGTNAYADTNYNVNTNASLDSHHISYYSRSNVNLSQVEFGVTTNNVNTDLIGIRFGGNTIISVNNPSSYLSYSDANSLGLYVANRNSSSNLNSWKNGLKKAEDSTLSTAKSNANLFIGAYNYIGTPLYYTTKECAFSSIGDGLTDGEATTFYNLVQAMQTTLSRQV